MGASHSPGLLQGREARTVGLGDDDPSLNLAIYLQHRVFRTVPLLWCRRGFHHALGGRRHDRTCFRPLELLVSLLRKTSLAVLLGTPPEAAAIFEILLNASSVLTHADLVLPWRIEWALRLVVVILDLHRIHHSERPEENCSHNGFCLFV